MNIKLDESSVSTEDFLSGHKYKDIVEDTDNTINKEWSSLK